MSRIQRSLFIHALLAAQSLFFVACGGGGGSETAQAPTETAPAITQQPASLAVTAGQTAAFHVVASGSEPLHYQWRKGSESVGTDSADLTIGSAQLSDAGSYGVTVSNAAGSATSGSATLTVNAGAVFRDDFDTAAIDSSVWQVATWKEHGGQTGTARCYARNGYLTLEFVNDPVQGYLSSAIQTRGTFLYGKWEARLKPSKVPGVLNSFYTIDWGDGSGSKQEIDIEFLTKSFGAGAGEVHYAVHAEGKPSFDTNPDVSLGFDPSDDFHVYGYEITPTEIRWTVDGTVLRTYVYSPSGITIDAPYQLKLNAWSATNWIGGPPAPGTVCTYLIDWIQFTPR